MWDDGCGGCRAAPLGSGSGAGMTEGGVGMTGVEVMEGGGGTTVWGVAAPVPWVPAFAGTTVFTGTTVGVF